MPAIRIPPPVVRATLDVAYEAPTQASYSRLIDYFFKHAPQCMPMLSPQRITSAFIFLLLWKPTSSIPTAILAVKAYHAYYALPPPSFHDPHVKMFMKGLAKVCKPSKARNGTGGSVPLPPDLVLDMLAYWFDRASQGKLDG